MALRELAQRQNDHFAIELLWDDEHGVVVLRVVEVDGDRVVNTVKVPPAAALDAFHHPSLYLEREVVA